MPEDPEGIEFSEAQGGGTHSGDHEHDPEKVSYDPVEGVVEHMSTSEEPMLPEAGTEETPSGNGGNGGSKARRMVASVDAGTVNVRGLVAVARADEASVKGVSGAVMSKGETSFTGGAGYVSGADMKVTGGAPVIVGRKEVDIYKGGAAVVGANKVAVQDHGYVGVVMARKVKVKPGGRVLITIVPAILMGVVFGVAFAVAREFMPGRQPSLMERGEKAIEPVVERVRAFEMPELPWRRRRGLLARLGLR